MLDGDTVVFVEVRYRRHAAWGGALESVDLRKQQKLIKAAQLFLLKESRWAKHPCRHERHRRWRAPQLDSKCLR